MYDAFSPNLLPFVVSIPNLWHWPKYGVAKIIQKITDLRDILTFSTDEVEFSTEHKCNYAS
jgi:hypothetical protein